MISRSTFCQARWSRRIGGDRGEEFLIFDFMKFERKGTFRSLTFGFRIWDSAARMGGMRELPHTHSCFVCGESNPVGFKLRSETDGRIVRAHFVFRPEHVGFKQTVHGGLTATILDEIMTWACAVQTKRFAYCAELSLRYLQPVRPHEPMLATAELIANRRGRLFEAKADLLNESG